MDKTAIRDAAAAIVVRRQNGAAAVLLGQRGAQAAFMPSKFVFPGGAVDPGDCDGVFPRALPEPCATRLAKQSRVTAQALVATAIRELWEETGQILGTAAPWSEPPAPWRPFARTGHRPDPTGLQFVFRAVTPAGRPRRFDARFFLVDASRLRSNPDDFSAAAGELSNLRWVPLAEARRYDLPFITQVVVGQVANLLAAGTPPAVVPFFIGEEQDLRIVEI